MKCTFCKLLATIGVFAAPVVAGGRVELIPASQAPYTPSQLVPVDVWIHNEEATDHNILWYLLDVSARRERLIAGGDFVASGPNTLNYVAKASGGAWEPVYAGLEGPVFALESCSLGLEPRLYAGGSAWAGGYRWEPAVNRLDDGAWTEIGRDSWAKVLSFLCWNDVSSDLLYTGGYLDDFEGSGCRGIVRWDGSSWSSIDGLNGAVRNMVIFDDGTGPALYAGGDFPNPMPPNSSVSLRGIAKWTGTAWAPLGGGLFTSWDEYGVHALAVFDDGTGPALYAGGAFENVYLPATDEFMQVNNLAKWDGVAWSPVGGGTPPETHSPVYDMIVFDDGTGSALYVGGRFASAGGVTVNNAAKWDGSNWSDLDGGVTGGSNPSVHALFVFDDGTGPALYVAGEFTTAGSTSVSNVARWNGTEWSAVAANLDGAVYALSSFPHEGVPNIGIGTLFSFDLSSLTNAGSTYWTRAEFPYPGLFYLGQELEPGTILQIPANGSLRIGAIEVAVPQTYGVYTLDVLSFFGEMALGLPGEPLTIEAIWSANDETLTEGTLDFPVVPESPDVAGAGSRYLAVTPHGADQVRLVVRSSCPSGIEQYVGQPFQVGSHGSLAFLVNDPKDAALLTPAEWGGTVFVGGVELTPSTNYEISTELDYGLRSAIGVAETWLWGDANNNGSVTFADITLVTDAFKGDFSNVTLGGADLAPMGTPGACLAPNRTVDFADITAAVDAFRSYQYPCLICP